MISRRLHTATVERLEADLRVNEVERERELAARRTSFELILRDIRQTIQGPTGLKRSEGTVDDYRWQHAIPHKHRAGIIRAANFQDGFAVTFTTASKFEDKAHYLLAIGNKFLEYGVYPIEVDCQAFESEPRVLHQADKLAADEAAVGHLKYCAGALAVESLYGWQNAFQQKDLARLGTPQVIIA